MTFLFGLPIYKDKIDPMSYDKEKIIKTAQYNYKLSKYRGSGYGEWHHSFQGTGYEDWHESHQSVDKRFKNMNYTQVNAVYREKLKKFCAGFLPLKKDYDIHFLIANYTANKQEAYMESHNHPHSDFAFVHYVQVPSGSSPIRFINQNGFAPYIPALSNDLYNMIDVKNSDNSWLFGNYTIFPEEDDLFIFPAVLFHQVPVAKAKFKKCRISIAGNLSIKKPREAQR